MNNNNTPLNTNEGELSAQSKISWNDIIEQWKTSGMSQVAFCNAHDINYNQFIHQRSKISSAAQRKNKLLPVNVLPNTSTGSTGSNFILHYPNGIKLTIPVNAHPEAIKTLLLCLESR